MSRRKKPEDECSGCPYGRTSPCIGWCTAAVIAAVGRKRNKPITAVELEGKRNASN